MENSTPLPLSSNPHTQILLQNSVNHVDKVTQKNSVKNFQEFVLQLAETHPNKPLTPATKTLLHGRLNQFVSEYKTPNHLPYSAMIQRALEELNAKRGSNEKSISRFLKKRYDNLPWAHSELLKHHLEKLCESGEIVVTQNKRYALPGCLNSSAEGKRKPPRRKWRYNGERIHGKDEVTKNNRECDKEEQRLTEIGARNEDNTDQPKRLRSCGDEHVHSEEAGPSGRAAQTHEQQEREESEYERPEPLSCPERPPVFENYHPLEPYIRKNSSVTKNLRPRPAKTEVANDANFVACTSELQHSVPQCGRLRVVFKQKPVADDVKNIGRRLRVLCKTKTGCS